jgi:hypothetical protein
MSTGKAQAQRAEQRANEDRQLSLAQLNAAKTPGYFEQQAIDDNKAYNTWKANKDYRTPAPGMISLGFGDPAQRQRMRERTFNMADTGLAALGGEGNATALGMAKLNMADELDRDQAGQYERAVSAEDAFQRGGAPTWAGMDQSRSLGIASLYNSNAQNSAQLQAQLRPQSLIPGLISGGFQLASAFASKTPCFAPGTRVTLADGHTKAIEDVCEGEWVLAHFADGARGVAKVLANEKSVAAPVLLEIALEGTKAPLRVTPEHLLSFSGGVFIEAGELSEGGHVHCFEPGDGWRLRRVLKVEQRAGRFEVYSLRTERPHTWFADSVAVHD